MKRVNDVDAIVGRQLRLARKASGVTQTTLGEKLGISFQQVQKYEMGASRMGAGRLQQAADILQVPISYFFEDQSLDAERLKLRPIMSTAQHLQLNQHFNKITSHAVRSAILELIKAIGDRTGDIGKLSDDDIVHKLLS